MNIKSLLLVAALFLTISSLAQSVNAKIKDPKLNNQEVLIGYCNLDGLTAGEYGVYFESQYEAYEPTSKYIEKLKENKGKVDILVVFGSWCSDSKIQVPRFFKVIDEAGFNNGQTKIIGVNRDKNAFSVNVMDLNIERVPTFIVYQNDEELGRIIETPKKTLEKDLAKIVARAK